MNILQRLKLAFTLRQLPMSTLRLIGQDSSTMARAWKYPQYSEEGYRKNAVVKSAISAKMSACGAVGFALAKDGEQLETIPPALVPLNNLLKRPNPNQSMDEFLQRWVMHMDLGGSAPLQAIGVGTQRLGEIERTKEKPELWLRRPDYVTVMAASDGTLAGYEYRPGGKGQVIKLSPDEMMVWRYPHPDSEFEGLSPLASLEEYIDAQSLSVSWNRNLLKNMGRLSGMLLLKGLHLLGQNDRERIQQEIKAQISGAQNAGEIFVGPGEGMDYHQMGANAADLDWLNGGREFMRRICVGLGVPPKMLGDPEAGTYANYKEARRAFYTDTVLPLMGNFVSELNEWLLPKYGAASNGVEIVLVTDHIDALRDDDNDLYKRLQAASGWMTINDQRRATGLPDIEGGDELPSSTSGFDSFAQDGQASYRSYKTRRIPRGKRYDGTKIERKYTAALRPKLSAHTEKAIKALDKAGVIEAFQGYVAKQYGERHITEADRRSTVDQVWLEGKAKSTLSAIGLDLDKITGDYTKELFGDASTFAFGKLGTSLTWNLDSPAVAKAVKARQNKIKDVTDTVHTQILDTIRTVIYDEGGSPVTPDTLKRIGELAGTKAEHEAERIARTESLSVASQAQHTVFSENGVAKKEWIHSGSSYPRHQGLAGEIVDIDEPFSNGLMYPGDPNGSDEEVINCMCAHAPVGIKALPDDEWVTE